MVSLLCSTLLSAQQFDDGGLRYEITSDTTVSIISNDWWDIGNVEVKIPSIATRVNDIGISKKYKITSIGESAFRKCPMGSLTVPSSIASIGDHAFSDCIYLTKLIISDGTETLSFGSSVFENAPLEYIYLGRDFTCFYPKAEMPFSGKNSITSVTIGDMTPFVGSEAFSDCSGLTSAKIGNSVKGIGINAFRNCHSLESVSIPGSVTSMGSMAFSGYNLKKVEFASVEALLNIRFQDRYANPLHDTHTLWIAGKEVKDLKIPASISIIKNDALCGCSGLSSVTIPESVTIIGDDAFEGCSGLTSVNIPNSVTSIGQNAFIGCNGLTSVKIGDSVTRIGASAFSGCKAMTSLAIGHSVTSIGESAFSGCRGLISVTIPNSVAEIGEAAFFKCSNLTSVSISNSLTSINRSVFRGCSSLTSVTIPNSVIEIGYLAFCECTGLKSVSIGESVAWVNWSSFSSCNNLTSILVDQGNKSYASIDGVLFDKNAKQLILFPGGKEGKYIIPNSVVSIGENAFASCSGLTSVTIPSSVTSISENAFSICSGLTSLTIPNSVTEIGKTAFKWCTGLTSVSIPESVTEMGEFVFVGCDGLTSVYYNSEDPIEASLNIFNSNYDIVYNQATLYVPAESVEKCKRIDPWKNFQNVQAFDFSSKIQEISENIDVSLPYEVFTLGGNKVSGDLDSLSPGVYIIRQGNTVKKIAVK